MEIAGDDYGAVQRRRRPRQPAGPRRVQNTREVQEGCASGNAKTEKRVSGAVQFVA